MRRWDSLLGAAAAALLAACLGSSQTVDAAAAPHVGMEMLILIPRGHHLSVFEQVTGARQSVAIGVLQQARKVRVVGGSLISRNGSSVTVSPINRHAAVRYRVPWNGRSVSLRLAAPDRIAALVVLVKPSLRLPAVLNPTLGSVGQGRIPGVPNSPTFDEYGASRIPAGQSVPLVLEHVAGAGRENSQGDHPVTARVFELLAGLASLAALYGAINWRPVESRAASTDRALEDLAAAAAAFRRGDLDEQRYRAQRRELLNRIRSGGPSA